MSLDALLVQLAMQVRQCANGGAAVDLATCEGAYIDARNLWTGNPFDPRCESFGRYASLIYGGALGLQPNWGLANAIYREPLEDTPVNEGCEMFAGLMAVGRAVSFWHLGDKDNAGWEAIEAQKLLRRAPTRGLDAWRGIAALIQDVTKPTKNTEPRSVRSLLDETTQPEACRLAEYFRYPPGSYRTMFELMELGYNIPATEGLYLFREQDNDRT